MVLICSSVLLLKPSKNSILTAFLITIPLNISLQYLIPEMNYFLRAFWVIFSGLLIALIFNLQKIQNLYKLTYVSSKNNLILGCFLLTSLIIIHIIFH